MSWLPVNISIKWDFSLFAHIFLYSMFNNEIYSQQFWYLDVIQLKTNIEKIEILTKEFSQEIFHIYEGKQQNINFCYNVTNIW